MSEPRHSSGARLVVVTGKGGVGKSLVTAALGVSATNRGLRTLVAELAGRGDVARLLGGRASGGLREVQLQPNLWHITIEREPALEEYLRQEAPGPLPAQILARSRLFGVFVDATPGMGELLTVGKLWELCQHPRHKRHARSYDLVVLDAPSTGQALALLQAPRTFGAIARVGPVARQAGEIDRMLTDPDRTQVVVVAIPEQMSVTETLELNSALSAQLGVRLTALVVNRLLCSPLTPDDRAQLRLAPDDPAVGSARWLDARARAEDGQVQRLRGGVGTEPSTKLPFLFRSELGRDDVQQFAGMLEGLL